MVWNIEEYKWEIMYKEAQRYFEKNQHLLVEETYITESGLELGRWMVQQRQVFKNNTSGKLRKDQIKKLTDIHMVWDNVLEAKWQQKYKEVKAFYDKNHFLPTSSVADKKYYDIYRWIKNQKNAYRQQKLSPEKIAKLKAINIIKPSKTIKKDLKDYLENLKNNGIFIDIDLNKEVLFHISYLEFASIMHYLMSNELAFTTASGKLIDMFSMANTELEKTIM